MTSNRSIDSFENTVSTNNFLRQISSAVYKPMFIGILSHISIFLIATSFTPPLGLIAKPCSKSKASEDDVDQDINNWIEVKTETVSMVKPYSFLLWKEPFVGDAFWVFWKIARLASYLHIYILLSIFCSQKYTLKIDSFEVVCILSPFGFFDVKCRISFYTSIGFEYTLENLGIFIRQI